MKIGRRDLLKLMAKVIISITTLSFLSSILLRRDAPERVITNEDSVFIAKFEDLEEATAVKFEIGGEAGLLTRFKGSLQAFIATCPHMGCPVSGRALATKGIIECPCHGSTFDPLSGERLSGPAPGGLIKIGTEVKEGKIYAVRFEALK